MTNTFDDESPQLAMEMKSSRTSMLLVSLFAGVIFAVLSEWLFTGIEVKPSNAISAVLLSPITLTVGGGHFPAIDSIRWLFFLQGLLTFPAIIVVCIIAHRANSFSGYFGLVIVVAWLYFGLLHRHAAIMSI